jgi:mono/diheme cytochrome c family protein
MIFFRLKGLFLLIGMTLVFFCKAEDGNSLFTRLCTPCHTIGNGRLVGPDLMKITEKKDKSWLIPFIQSSQSIIKGGDADAIALFEEYNKIMMPDQALSSSEVESVLEYIELKSGQGGQANTVDVVDLLSSTTDENIAQGLLLFSGKKRLENGGIVCISCHSIKDDNVFSSGKLAKDLTLTYSVMGSAGVSAILNSPPFPAMSETYKNNPLTEEEVLNLTAYLRSVGENHYYQHPVDFGATFASFGIIVFIMLNLGIIILYFRRKRNTVNQEILNRQSL